MNHKQELSRQTAWVWLTIFLGIVALVGGSSSPEAIQLAVLRPFAALMLIPTLYYIRTAQLRDAKILLFLLAMLAFWMALQIVPLPPEIWQTLPGRDVVVALDAAVGLEGNWRPISFVPTRSWNSLASLVVPSVAVLLALSMRATPRMLLLLIAGLGFFDAALGLLQVISGRSSVLYFYAVTNRGSPVGIFANENHSAVFSAIALLVVAHLSVTTTKRDGSAWLRLAFPPAYLVILLAVLVSGSRAGLAMAFLALLSSGVVVWLGITSSRSNRSGSVEKWLASHPRTLLALFALVVTGLLGMFFGLDRAQGLEDIIEKSPIEDLRWRLWPVLEQMIGSYWLLGIGFGSFEDFYNIYEPSSLLSRYFVNHAHNDWAQLVIEGGLPAMVILLALLLRIALMLLSLLQDEARSLGRVLFWAVVVAILCAASIVDYPLRAPAFQLAAVWLLLALVLESNAKEAAE